MTNNKQLQKQLSHGDLVDISNESPDITHHQRVTQREIQTKEQQ